MSPMSTQTLSRATPSPLSKWATGLMWQNWHDILFSALWMVLCRFNAAAEGRNSELVGNSVMKKVFSNIFLHQGWFPQLVEALTVAGTGWTSWASSKRTPPTPCPFSRRSLWDFLIYCACSECNNVMYQWFGFWVIGLSCKIWNAVQGVDLKFPVDNEMLRGCYGNRPSCLAKDLPSEVGLTMKNRWKQKQKLSYQGSFFRWWPALTLRCSLINVQSHDYAAMLD